MADSSTTPVSGPVAAPARPPIPSDVTVDVHHLNFDYGTAAGHKPVLIDITFALPKGSRMLLVGDNGAGKSTLLRVLAGRHIHRDDAVTVLGRHAFFDTALNNRRSYLACDWGRRTVAFTGHGCALQADIGVTEMMAEAQVAFKERRDKLVELLGIDLTWRMHMLSDGQRRRVQIMLQLLQPAEVVLLDEITTDLDLITRQDFLNYIKAEAEERGMTIVYATHIFDGLDDWPTHIGYIAEKRLAKFAPVSELPDLMANRSSGIVAPLLRTIEKWFRADRDARRACGKKITEDAELAAVDELRGAVGNGYLSGRFNQGFS